MEINKIVKRLWFRCIYNKGGRNITHGLYNFGNIVIGYNYQDKRKGFWIVKQKWI